MSADVTAPTQPLRSADKDVLTEVPPHVPSCVWFCLCCGLCDKALTHAPPPPGKPKYSRANTDEGVTPDGLPKMDDIDDLLADSLPNMDQAQIELITRAIATGMGLPDTQVINDAKDSVTIHMRALSSSSVTMLAKSLRQNSTITSLALFQNGMGDTELKAFGDLFKKSKTLLNLEVEGNLIDEQGAQYLKNQLGSNKSLRKLNLGHNAIGDLALSKFSPFLHTNTSITELNLSNQMPKINDTGMRSLTQALTKNNTLKMLDLSQNAIGCAGANDLAQMLVTKKGFFAYLKLEQCQVGTKGVLELLEAVRNNQVIQVLDLNYQSPPEPLDIEKIRRARRDIIKTTLAVITCNLDDRKDTVQGLDHWCEHEKANMTAMDENLKQNDMKWAMFMKELEKDIQMGEGPTDDAEAYDGMPSSPWRGAAFDYGSPVGSADAHVLDLDNVDGGTSASESELTGVDTASSPILLNYEHGQDNDFPGA